MVETADGHRVLVAPDEGVADFVSSTYTFDEVRIEPIGLGRTPDRLSWRSATLVVDLEVGGPTVLGRALSLVPDRLAAAPAWTTVTDPLARLLLSGVRTRGSAGGGRREWYGALGVRRISAVRGSFDAGPLGALAPVDPPCRFGFGSTPSRPSLTRVVTTIEIADKSDITTIL